MNEENSIDNNPYIKPENYYAGYQDSIEKLKDKPEIVQFDKKLLQHGTGMRTHPEMGIDLNGCLKNLKL